METFLLSLWTSLVAFCASVLSGVVGFGGAMLFLPVLVSIYGVRASVPILTVSVLFGNASRVYFNRGELNLRAAGLFLLGAIPFAVLGSLVYAALPTFLIKKGIGVFLILTVVLRRVHPEFKLRQIWIFLPLGMGTGFLSALMGGVGPISSPFFLAYGLTKEAFVGTEALCAVGMHTAKSISYHRLHLLNAQELASGVIYGLVMVLGSYTSKKILEKISRQKFVLLVEIMLTVVGILMLVG